VNSIYFDNKNRLMPHGIMFHHFHHEGDRPYAKGSITSSEFQQIIEYIGLENILPAKTWRPYCHVQDFARVIQMVIEAPNEKVSFEVFNAGGDINNATKQMIVDTILENIPDGKIRYKDHGSDPRNYRISFEKVKSVLGFEPKHTIQDGIEELIEAINKHVFDHVDENKNFFGNYEINYNISHD